MKFGVGVDYSLKALLLLADKYPDSEPVRVEEIAGTQGVMRGRDDPVGAFGQQWLGARTGTIAGGSQEMARNGVSERVLGLPREATPDRGVPFSEVLAARRQRG